MLWLFQNVLFSFSLIVIIHYLYIYFKTTLTTPRVKDLIHCPKQKYDTLFDIIEKGNKYEYETTSLLPHSSGSGSDLGIPIENDQHIQNNNHINNSNEQVANNIHAKELMKNDLKAFLKTVGLKNQTTQHHQFSSINS